MEKKIKVLRLRIDGLGQLVKGLEGSAELTKAHNGLMLGKAWLGKVLGALGTPSPYPKDGERKSIADIEPTADKDVKTLRIIRVGASVQIVDRTNEKWKLDSHIEASHIEKVDILRQEIADVLREVLPMYPDRTWDKKFLYEQWAHKHLSEARFWLGFHLEAIRNRENG